MKVYLLGAANPETIRVVRSVEKVQANFFVAGFLDNDVSKHGKDFFGIPIVGGVEKIPEVVADDVRFVNLITGNTFVRHTTTQEILTRKGVLTNLIHPSIDLTMTEVGVGLYLQESVILQAGVSVGNNTSIHMGALIGHETKIGESVFIAHAVSVSGCCDIGEGVFVGTNATILPRVKIGKWATVGAGSVVTKDVPDYCTVVGSPARIIKTGGRND
jgi:sugar O-acyltransferase (sialic acid O-acetyltransferase NeuD family)